MTKKPYFWIAVTLASALCFFFSWRFFTEAFPTLNVDVKMTRAGALDAASRRVAAHRLAPADARTAVRFSNDSNAQNFIELEGGGKDAFIALLKQDIYQSLQWEVRFFREKEADNVSLFFTPQGKSYGFTRHIPEKSPGPALDAAAAREIAETVARRDWDLDLSAGKSPYAPAEQSFQTRPNGRVDHFFVYERSAQRLGKNGEGRIRVTLQIAGDQLVQLRHQVKIPESFERRYAEMRAANTNIATVASLLMGVLYLLGGCVFGLVILRTQHFVVVRPAVKWALLIASLQGAMMLSQIPSGWFNYDTAISANAHIAQAIAMTCAAFLGSWMLLAVSFMAAESLSRKAFGHHPQLWRLWRADAANSTALLGRTIGGYLWVGFDLMFITAFYYVTQHYFGWWSPLESLVDPNILANPLPALEPIANALYAGFWEECLFRAVPLAGAALIGDYMQRRFQGRWGGRRAWLMIGLVVEALIFGAAHASYAQQPSYARPLELFLPAIMWGVVYLRFGLLPGIIFHFVFDLLLMSLPLFVSSAPGLGLDRGLVIAAGLVPLLVLAWARWRAGGWRDLPESYLNAAWTPSVPQPGGQENPEGVGRNRQHGQESARGLRTWLPLLGVFGLAAWLWYSPFKQDSLPLYLDRSEAESAAEVALVQRGVALSGEWKRFSEVVHDQQESDAFIWREGGAAIYAKLAGSYLPPPVWAVRYVRFDGDVAERAEEWLVFVENGVDGKGGREAVPHIRDLRHSIPEARAGKSLTVEQARARAHETLRKRFQREPSDLREISAHETKRPNRKDWEFTFADDRNYPLKTGEAHVSIHMAGDEVVLAGRLINVPEEWQRAERERRSLMRNVQIGVGLLAAALAIGILIVGLMRSMHGGLVLRQFFRIGSLVFILSVFSAANSWQGVAINLTTEQSLESQLWIRAAGLLIGFVMTGLSIGMLAGIAAYDGKGDLCGKFGSLRTGGLLLPGISLAALLVGMTAGLNSLSVPEAPHWASLALLNQNFPVIGSALDGSMFVLRGITVLTFVLMLLNEFNANFSKRRAPTIFVLFVVGLASAMDAPILSGFLIQGLATGLFLTLLYVLLVRFEPKVLLVALMVKPVFAQINLALVAPYPHAQWYALVYTLALCLTGIWWLRLLDGNAGNGEYKVGRVG